MTTEPVRALMMTLATVARAPPARPRSGTADCSMGVRTCTTGRPARSPCLAELAVQRRHDVLRGAEVGVVHFQVDIAVARERGWHAALDDGAAADAAAVELVDLHAGTTGRGARAADQDVALGDGVDLAVRALERGHQQRAAAQALGVAHGGHHHVHRLTGPCEGRQRGRDHHRRHVLQLHVAAGGHGDASCDSMLVRLCWVNGVWRTWSPLPSRPTTRP